MSPFNGIFRNDSKISLIASDERIEQKYLKIVFLSCGAECLVVIVNDSLYPVYVGLVKMQNSLIICPFFWSEINLLWTNLITSVVTTITTAQHIENFADISSVELINYT
jgi:hypothetical protein